MTGALSTSGQRARFMPPLGAAWDTPQTQCVSGEAGPLRKRSYLHVFMSLAVGIVAEC